jgi:hypothetical protein
MNKMHKGDTVVCVTSKYYDHLVVGKHYIVEQSFGGYITLEFDNDDAYAYQESNFILLSEYREEILNRLL